MPPSWYGRREPRSPISGVPKRVCLRAASYGVRVRGLYSLRMVHQLHEYRSVVQSLFTRVYADMYVMITSLRTRGRLLNPVHTHSCRNTRAQYLLFNARKDFYIEDYCLSSTALVCHASAHDCLLSPSLSISLPPFFHPLSASTPCPSHLPPLEVAAPSLHHVAGGGAKADKQSCA